MLLVFAALATGLSVGLLCVDKAGGDEAIQAKNVEQIARPAATCCPRGEAESGDAALLSISYTLALQVLLVLLIPWVISVQRISPTALVVAAATGLLIAAGRFYCREECCDEIENVVDADASLGQIADESQRTTV